MSAHEHKAEHSARFHGYSIEVCECGATRQVAHDGRAEPWHACDLCAHPWGME